MDTERFVKVQIGGRDYYLLLTTRATKEIGKRYGGIDKLGEKLLAEESFEQAIDEVLWLICLLANQSILVKNLTEGQNEPLLTEETLELMTTPADLFGLKDAIMDALNSGLQRNVLGESSKNQATG